MRNFIVLIINLKIKKMNTIDTTEKSSGALLLENTIRTNLVIKNLGIVEDFLHSLNAGLGGNVILGGSAALQLHGLNLSRRVDDLDIIIYKPTEEQMKVLELMEPFNLSLFPIYSEFEKSERRVRKFEIRGVKLDIILEKEIEKPQNLLLFHIHTCFTIPIQSIENVIAAKNSYTLKEHTYRRSKDMEDLIDLKNKNFNF